MGRLDTLERAMTIETIENAKKEQDSFQTHPYRGGEKLPKFYDYKTFIDSDGSKINVDDIKEKISVDYNNIMFSNLDKNSNSLLIYFFALAEPEGTETTGNLLFCI